MRIALFTAFSPDTGGGATQLRGILPELRTLDITWYYLAPQKASLPVAGCWLGPPLPTFTIIRDLFLRTRVIQGSTKAVKNLVSKMEADLYWIVAHNEGISVASELRRLGKKVHLTVHDDPVAYAARSRKYWAFQALIGSTFSQLLKSSTSVDVISLGMRDFYKEAHAVDSFPVYRYVPSLPKMIDFLPSSRTLRIGHIGILYLAGPFRRFVHACRLKAEENNQRLEIIRIGKSPEMDRVAYEHPDLFQDAGQLNEEDAVSVLSSCNFLYAMYPDGNRFSRFRRTSMPMKLTTYIQAQRPIFAHTPEDSTLATAVLRYRLGEVCSSTSHSAIRGSIEAVLNKAVCRTDFDAFREDILGLSQVQKIRAVLSAEY